MVKKFYLYFILIGLAYVVAFITTSIDPDLWHRLAVGSLFFQTGGVLKHDIFAYTPTKDIWIDHEWGSGVIFYFITKHFGEWGLLNLKAILLFSIFLLIVKTIQLNKINYKNINTLYLIFVAFSLFPGIASPVRCQIFTYLFFTLWIYILEKVRRGENRLLWILPATMLLWVNMHGGFVVGLGLIFIYAIGELLNKKNPLKYFAILAITLLVTLINPYGLKFWHYIIEATTMSRPGIDEWKPLTFSEANYVFWGIPVNVFIGFMIFTGLTLAVGIKSVLQSQKFDWVKILLFLILIYFGIAHKRHTMFLILSASSLLYFEYGTLITYLTSFIKPRLSENLTANLSKLVYIFNFVVLVGIFGYIYHLPKELIVHPGHYPVGSIQFLEQNNISGNVLTTYRWGNYVLWKLYPKCLVAVDGRYEEVYPDEVFNEAINFQKRLGDNWHIILDKYRADILIVDRSTHQEINSEPLKNWQIVYSDAVSHLLLPKNKVKKFYINPNYGNKIYWHEDLSKQVYLD